VLFTGEHEQLTVMRLQPGEDIGREVHDDHDQFLRIEEGRARVELGRDTDEVEETHEVEDDWAIIVPAVWHKSSTWEMPTSSCIPSTPLPSIRRLPSTTPRPRQTPRSERTTGRSELIDIVTGTRSVAEAREALPCPRRT
jgi:hypothetical protein